MGSSVSVQFETIPQSLKDIANWIVWRYDDFKYENGVRVPCEPFKCLYQPRNPEYKAKSTDPETWSDYGQAVAAYVRGGWEGIGFVFHAEDEMVGVDLDNCRNPETGKWADWSREIIAKLDTYAELSPSGTGAKLFMRGQNPFTKGVNRKVDQVPMVEGKEPGIEVYSSGRYFAVTGRRLARCPAVINERTEQLIWLADTYLKEEAEAKNVNVDDWIRTPIADRAAKYLERIPPAVSGSGGSKVTFRAACVLVLEFALSVQEAFPILKAWSDATAQPPWSDKELMHKLEDANRQPGLRGKLRTASQRDYDLIDIPEYYERPARKPQKTQPEIRQTLLKDAAFKYLENVVTGKSKTYDTGIPDLDYAIGGGVESGEMIMIVGRPNHGKNVCCQQIIYTFGRQKIPSLLISEEMSPLNLGKRAIHTASAIPRESWQYREQVVRDELEQFFADMAPCYIVENCRTAERVAEEIKRHVETYGIGVVGIDYAQKLTTGDKNRYADITKVSMALKDAISENDIPGFVLAQASREIEKRPSFIPIMSDMKETGQFEADADVVVFSVWPHRIDSNKPASEYKLYVMKNRNREINQPVINCTFLPSRGMLVPSQESGYNASIAFDAAEAFPQKYGFNPDPML